MKGDKRLAELEALIAAGYGDTPQDQIPPQVLASAGIAVQHVEPVSELEPQPLPGVFCLESTVNYYVARYAPCIPSRLIEDLRQSAWVGAIRAANRFDASCGVALRTYADRLVRGAVKDFLRGEDPLSRDHRRDVKAGLAEAPTHLELDAPVADHREGFQIPAAACDPTVASDVQRLLRYLDRRQKRIVTAYFFRDRTMLQISKREHINQSRVSQIIKASIQKMREVVEPTREKKIRRDAIPRGCVKCGARCRTTRESRRHCSRKNVEARSRLTNTMAVAA